MKIIKDENGWYKKDDTWKGDVLDTVVFLLLFIIGMVMLYVM